MAVPPRSVVHTIATHRLVPIGDVLENLKGEGQRRGTYAEGLHNWTGRWGHLEAAQESATAL